MGKVISIVSIDNLLENTSETNWSKTDIAKLAPINKLLEKLNETQTEKLQEIIQNSQDWKVSELLLAVYNILNNIY